MPEITIYESDGSDGYTEGTWGYIVRDGRHMDCDGGWPSRECAEEAAQNRAKNW